MILTFSCALVLSVFLIWFVLQPLFAAENMEVFSATYKGFADENELKQVLQLRDQLFERLTSGVSSEPRIKELSESDCFEVLVSLALRLQRAELPFLPQQNTKGARMSATDKGFARARVLFSIAILALCGWGLMRFTIALGQPLAPATSEANQANPHQGLVQKRPLVESLHVLEPGVFLPTSNRYMISPAQAEVVVHHVSSFSVPSTQQGPTTIALAVPENLYDWQIVEMKPESLAAQVKVTSWNGFPAVQLPAGTQGLAITITSEFRLSAKFGRAVWKNEKLSGFPGEQVAIFFEVPGVLKQIFGSVAENWNVWPPRVARPGNGTQITEREITMGQGASTRRVQLMSRAGQDALPFLQFEVIGLVPSRLPLIILGTLVGAVLFGVSLTVFARKARWRIDTPEGLPG